MKIYIANQKRMKKLFPVISITLFIVFVSCAESPSKEQIIADSIAASNSRYDSMAAVANELLEAQRNLELASELESIIDNPIKIGNLLVAKNDFPNNMEWSDAQKACVNLGPGWRLPTISELKILHQNQKIIGVMCCKWYWSSTPFDEKRMEFLELGNGFWGAEYKVRSYAVRAVRDF